MIPILLVRDTNTVIHNSYFIPGHHAGSISLLCPESHFSSKHICFCHAQVAHILRMKTLSKWFSMVVNGETHLKLEDCIWVIPMLCLPLLVWRAPIVTIAHLEIWLEIHLFFVSFQIPRRQSHSQGRWRRGC